MLRRDFLRSVAILTGSVAFGVATRNSDEDYLIHAQDAKAAGVDVGNLVYDPDYPLSFRSHREGNINLIIYESEIFKHDWMKAHKHCCIEKPREKARRKEIFDHYMIGTPLHR